MKYQCPFCGEELIPKNTEIHPPLECKNRHSYSWDFVDGFWQGVTAEKERVLRQEPTVKQVL